MTTLTIVLFLILVPAAYVAAICNSLIRKQNLTDEAFSGIGVQFKKRADLIPNLVEVVKAYAAHERNALEEVTRLRVEAVRAGNREDVLDRARAKGLLGDALTRLLALAESYPNLKANLNFLDLQGRLARVEDDLELARRYFNGTVRNLNIRIESFPSNLVARVFGFASREFFNLEDETGRRVPRITA